MVDSVTKQRIERAGVSGQDATSITSAPDGTFAAGQGGELREVNTNAPLMVAASHGPRFGTTGTLLRQLG